MNKPTYIFDFDSTVVTLESLDELANIALVNHPDRHDIMEQLTTITNQGMTGNISFSESLQKRLALFSADKDNVSELIALLKQHISPSFLQHRGWLEKNAEHIYIMSGGFTDYIAPIADFFGITHDHIFANQFLYDEHDRITGYDKNNMLSQPRGKVLQLESLNLPRPLIMIGDGFTDYETRKYGQADIFYAFTETVRRPEVITVADRIMESFDPSALVDA